MIAKYNSRAVTAAGKSHLRTLPLARLKKYVDAYHLKADQVVEKDDLVDILIAARVSTSALTAQIYV